MTGTYILAIDQGTTSSRAVVFDGGLHEVASAQQEFPQQFPASGWVEHDPEAIWGSVEATVKRVIERAGIAPAAIAAVGITNQRETTVVWDADSGKAVYDAIVWQDRRTAERCRELSGRGLDETVASRTGLRLDPYFSATKLAWILDNVPGARDRAEAGSLRFGTIDSFLIWRLTGGRVHRSDVTNASRTMLYDIHRQAWDEELLAALDIPASLLPEVDDCTGDFGITDKSVLGFAAPIAGVAGDQQAALFGQACFEPGMIKSTYGTGCFVIAHTGDTPLNSSSQLLTTIASRIDGEVAYGLEGSIFVAGSAVQWLRDGIGIIGSAAETEQMARDVGVVDDVHVVPAFTGLGAPYWDPDARGAMFGLTRDTGPARIATATLQSIAYQTCDLMRSMADDGIRPTMLRVDGGMVANDWFVQFLADMVDVTIQRPRNTESTVLGAAALAGLSRGVFASRDELARLWQQEREFRPRMAAATRKRLYAGWRDAVARIR
ncbi:MAG: glycerol kinase GlpK [Pseudomonadota bacterium]